MGPTQVTAQQDVMHYPENLGDLPERLEHEARSRTHVGAPIDQLGTHIEALLPTVTTNADVPLARSGNGVTDYECPRVDSVTGSFSRTSPSIEIQAHKSRVSSFYEESDHNISVIPTVLPPIQPTARPNNERDTMSNPLPTIPPLSHYTGYNVEPEASYGHVLPSAEQIALPASRPYTDVSSEQLLHTNQDQQRELLQYLRGLNEWLERDSADRRAEYQSVVARFDELKDDVNRITIRNEAEVPAIPNCPQVDHPPIPRFRRSIRPYPRVEELAVPPIIPPLPEEEDNTETRARRPRRRYADTRRSQSDQDESSAESAQIVVPPPPRPSPPTIPGVYVGPQYQSRPTLAVPHLRPQNEEPWYYSSMQEIDERVPPVAYTTVNPFEASPRSRLSQNFRPSPRYTHPQTIPILPTLPYTPDLQRGSSYQVQPGPDYRYDGPFIPTSGEPAVPTVVPLPSEDEYIMETRARRPRRRSQSDEDDSNAGSPTHIVDYPPARHPPPTIPGVYVIPQHQTGPTPVIPPPHPQSEEPIYYPSMQEIDERVPPVSYATVNPFEASLRPRPSRSQSFRPSPYYTYPQTSPLPPVPPYMPGMPDLRHRRGSSYVVHPGPVYYDGPFIPPPPPPPPPPQDEEAFDCGFLCLPLSCQIASSSSIRGKIGIFLIAIYTFFVDTAPRQLYLHFLLRLPSLYFNRVSRIFEDAELILPDIKKMAIATADQWKGNEKGPAHMMMMSEQNYAMSPNLIDFKRSWETFVDSLMREWKTSNVVSVLLLSAILTMLQIDGAGTDPVPKYAALLSLICALMSLLYGCIYIIRFGSMKKMYKAASWAEEAQKTKTLLWWNVWVLLAMPAVWLAWSIILFITCILTYVWRSGSTTDASDPILLSPHAILGPRIAVTAVFALGVVYFFLIANTFGHYGESMDNAWRQKVVGWAKEGGGGRSYQNRTRTNPGPSSNYYDTRSQRPTNQNQHHGRVYSPRPPSSTLPGPSSNYYDPRSQRPTNENQHHGRAYSPRPPGSTLQQESPYVQRRRSLSRNLYAPSFQRPVDPTARHRPFGPEKLYNLTDLLDIRASYDVPSVLMEHDVNSDDWEFFISDIKSSYNRGSPNDIERTSEIIETWNKQFFVPRLVEISLCIEELDSSDTPNHALYMISPPSPFNEEHWVNTMDRGLLPHAVRRLVPYLDRHAPPMPPSPPPPRHSESSRVHFRTALSQE